MTLTKLDMFFTILKQLVITISIMDRILLLIKVLVLFRIHFKVLIIYDAVTLDLLNCEIYTDSAEFFRKGIVHKMIRSDTVLFLQFFTFHRKIKH